MCPSKHRHGATFLYVYSEKPPHLVAFYDTEDTFSTETPSPRGQWKFGFLHGHDGSSLEHYIEP